MKRLDNDAISKRKAIQKQLSLENGKLLSAVEVRELLVYFDIQYRWWGINMEYDSNVVSQFSSHTGFIYRSVEADMDTYYQLYQIK